MTRPKSLEEVAAWVRERHDWHVREASKAQDCANESGQFFNSLLAVGMNDVYEKITGERIPREEIVACHTQEPKFECPHCKARIDPRATKVVWTHGLTGVSTLICYGCHEEFEVENLRAAMEKAEAAV